MDMYNSTLEEDGAPVAMKTDQLTLADAISKEVKLQLRPRPHTRRQPLLTDICSGFDQEKNLVNRFSEATAENTQRQKQMALARNLMVQVRRPEPAHRCS